MYWGRTRNRHGGGGVSVGFDGLPPQRHGEQHMKAVVKWAICLIAVLAFTAISALGAEISGRVTDHVGATQPNARVVLRKLDRSVKLSRETGSDGQFRFADLMPGRYELRVSCTCFRTVIQRLILDADSRVNLDINLKLADKRCVGID